MSSSLRDDERSDPVGMPETFRPTPAKAGLRSDRVGPAFADVVKSAVLTHYGSVKAAAISLNVDPSLMQREFEAGKFARLEQADDATKASVAKALYEQFGQDDPKAQIRRALRDAKQALTDVEEWMARG